MYKLISFVEKVYSHRNLLKAAIKQISFAAQKYLLPVKRSKINVLKFLLQFLRRHNLRKKSCGCFSHGIQFKSTWFQILK